MGFLSKWLSDLHRINAARQIRTGMKAEFQDDKGRWWYSFPDPEGVPIMRYSEVNSKIAYLTAGVSGQIIDMMMDNVSKCLAHGKIVEACAVIAEVQELRHKIINFNAVVNVLAASYVREDENPVVFSKSIHQEKCDFLESETEDGRFFFRMPMFLQLLNGIAVSSEDLTEQYDHFYQVQMKQLMSKLESLASMSAADLSQKTK